MNRKPILGLLNDYVAFDVVEKQMVSDTICFISANKDCFERTLLEGHVTGSAWIIDKDANNVVLLHHTKLDKWFQPGGHCDGEWNVMIVAAKEALEETGLKLTARSVDIFDVDIHEIPERNGVPRHLHYDIKFLFIAEMKVREIQHNHESREVRWVPLQEVENYSNDLSIFRMVQKTILAGEAIKNSFNKQIQRGDTSTDS